MIIAAATTSPVLRIATADQRRIDRPRSSRIRSRIVSIVTPLLLSSRILLLTLYRNHYGVYPTDIITRFVVTKGGRGITPHPPIG